MEKDCAQLMSMLSNTNLTRRRQAMRTLQHREFLPCILEAMSNHDTTSEMKRLITEIIYRARWQEALPSLIQQLRTRDSKLRSITAEALGAIGDASAGPALLEILSDKDQPTSVRDTAALSLGMVRYRPAMPHLVATLADPADSVRRTAAQALQLLADPSAIEALQHARDIEANQRVRAAIDAALVAFID